jgi:hypothetical protein
MPLAINNESMRAMRLGVSEINRRKVDEYRVKGLSWSAVSVSRGDGMDIPYNMLLIAMSR